MKREAFTLSFIQNSEMDFFAKADQIKVLLVKLVEKDSVRF